jgi:two-component system sensor histidine kinase KdpD
VHRALALGRVVASIAAVAAVTGLYFRFVQVSPTTVALSYVVAILLIASAWGIVEATIASLAAMVCFNFFFLPPVGTLAIEDPRNWGALVAFLLTAIVTSQLSGRARQRELEATARQRELEQLYSLSRALLLAQGGPSIPAEIARHIADAFELETVALFDRHAETISWAGATEVPGIEGRLRDVARSSVTFRDPSALTVLAIKLGGAPIGSLAIMGAGLSDTVLQSIANLAAIGLERARGQEAAARAEAARASGELRATVMDALAHEFKTPLTSMKAAASGLLAAIPADAPHRELATIVDEDLDRLQALVTDAVHMVRIDAGDFVVHRDRHVVADLVKATLRQFEAHLEGHPIVERVPASLLVDADRDLLGLALRQLLDNAVKYSPATSTIEIAAIGNGAVDIAVRNSGPAIPEREQGRILERFYRGADARHVPGTGIGLAIVQQIARAHGGSLTVSSSAEAGTAFTLSLPRGEITA